MGQLGEEQMWREASSQPGEAAQDGEPGQAGDRDPGWRRRGPKSCFRRGATVDQENNNCCNSEEEEEEGWREGEGRDKGSQRGEEVAEHVCADMKREAHESGF